MKWYQVTNRKLIWILGISAAWLILGWVLYILIGAKHGPKGGLDSIANAIAYVFLWRLLIFAPPALFTMPGVFAWLFQNHRTAFFLTVGVMALCLLSAGIFHKFIRKKISTPERIAARTEGFAEWERKQYGVRDSWTESDLVCEYIGDLVSETMAEYRSLFPEDNIGLRTSYIDAAMEAHYRELPHVEGWEYIPDIRAIIPAWPDGDTEFLLRNSELKEAAAQFQRTLNRDHWYDRYQFERSAIAEWYSWLPMLAVFYDDGRMDFVIAPG